MQHCALDWTVKLMPAIGTNYPVILQKDILGFDRFGRRRNSDCEGGFGDPFCLKIDKPMRLSILSI
jgi:hypothetical protein